MKIVIAQSDPHLRLLLCKTLEDEGFEVVPLRDGHELLDYADLHDVRLAIVGWKMPGLDTPALCRQIRERQPAGPYVHVIVIPDRRARGARAAAFGAGVDGFLDPPIDRSELLSRVQVVHRVIGMEDQLRRRSTELERLNGELELRNTLLAEIASCDGLTGLKNHRFFREALESHISLSRRKGLPLSVVMIDVDQFKPFNDSFGHPAGDEVLRDVARLLRSCVREHDVVARYGGEEFAVLLPTTDVEAGKALAERLRQAVEEHPWQLRPVTISLGIATLDLAARRPVAMIEDADRSLYRSKAEGRNRVTHADDATPRPGRDRSPDAGPDPNVLDHSPIPFLA